MPIYQLVDEHIFPHPSEADENGLLAIGGDLDPERLLLAYSNGIFPWYSDDSPILWWSPNPRMILLPKDLILQKSFKQKLRNTTFKVRFDTEFKNVIEKCQLIERKGEKGTWITEEMKEAYILLHHLGFAHSVEVFIDNELQGGLYGLSLGNAFFGESMFSIANDTSKIALYYLCKFCITHNFSFIDCQMHTEHLERMGASNIERKEFLDILVKAMKKETYRGKWTKAYKE